MSEKSENKGKKTLSLSKKATDKSDTEGAANVRQNFLHGRSKSVAVEVKRRRPIDNSGVSSAKGSGTVKIPEGMTRVEFEARLKLLAKAREAEPAEVTDTRKAIEEARRKNLEGSRRKTEEEISRKAEEEAVAIAAAQEEERKRSEVEAEAKKSEPEASQPTTDVSEQTASAGKAVPKFKRKNDDADDESEDVKSKAKSKAGAAKEAPARRIEQRRREGKLTLQQAIMAKDNDGLNERMRSEASLRRARERERLRLEQSNFDPNQKVVREVVLPETITVGELASRMAARGADVIKTLIKMGSMVTINEVIDADTAELVVEEFGHKVRRVSEADVELGIEGPVDDEATLKSRPPIVTVMGHVDHGKTSLLDALRNADVVSHEAGGITQHIGAYQIKMPSGQAITFIDTPGHAAFTAMRARGAQATDVVILVVAADDGIKEQTVEAINHIKAAGVPMIIAINKMDKPGANPDRVRNDLLSHEIVVEDLGGDVLCIEVSAKESLNLDKLEEAIALQAELLELKANPDRAALGVVIEAKIEQGRGSVATVLVQKGTLNVGDVFVAGCESGRVRALINDRGQQITSADPSTPVEVLGLNGTPQAGDDFIVVENETKAREIAEYRSALLKRKLIAARKPATLDDYFVQHGAMEKKVLPIVVKGDVQGSVEAIVSSLQKINNEEVGVEVLHHGVGGITESDVILAKASKGLIFGFNVRANPQARELARHDGVAIQYYSVIYDLIDDVKAVLNGMLSPTLKENYIGRAEIREVFNVTKVGKIAGCMVTEGVVKRGAKVRLLRDDVVIHEGDLKTLKRFKDEAKEAREGFECGMAFENYQDIREGDIIECFEVEEIQRTIED
jgi:translation initiation factor IF-2